MEDKYDLLQIVSRVWARFYTLPEHKNSKIEEYSIFIEIKNSNDECYLINAREEDFLWKGMLSGITWQVIMDEEELYKKRDLLGFVHVRFRDKPIKINNKILDPFPNYDFFWNYIIK
ncbi:MAG: hypothetical protein OEW69_08665 [Nitrospirota bacterium]|nr:hypothetical protein [Candidatus Aminicenantes bacterium]MDH5203314.1 hypothetical protein [Nitrospirota bacterium]MDH5743243.1 hypothetical protein [Candidatus Aminicenantes bacterium]